MFLENNYVTVVKLKKSIHDYFEKTKTKISKFQRSRKKNMIEIKMLLKSKLAIREKEKKDCLIDIRLYTLVRVYVYSKLATEGLVHKRKILNKIGNAPTCNIL